MLSLVSFTGMTRNRCTALQIGMLTGCPLCRESHPHVQVKEPYSNLDMVNWILSLYKVHPFSGLQIFFKIGGPK